MPTKRKTTHLDEELSDAEETKAAINAEGRSALLIEGDVRDPKPCRQAVQKTDKEFGKLDILVNNPAFQQHRETLAELSLAELSEEQWDQTFKTNIYGYFKADSSYITGEVLTCLGGETTAG